MMIEIPITQYLLDKTEERYANIPLRNEQRLHRFGSEMKRIFIGYLGETLVINYFRIPIVDSYEFDIILFGEKIDVKTISCKFKPPSYYLCTVNSCDLNGIRKQKADKYMFVRVLEDYSKGWILGDIRCEEFFNKGKFIRKGETYAGIHFRKSNAYVLPINQLNEYS
jgi:hypothetical protein